MNIVSDMDWLDGTAISQTGFEGGLESEVQQNLVPLDNELLKRTMDIVITLTLGLALLPILLFVALLIHLDAPGPIFYTQERLGKDGHKIRIYKFRSMHVNADKVLAEYLAENPSAREEWLRNQKLRNDPRVTRTGKWIRQFSIDEIPQLFNVLKGDMSVVGPRPIMLEQKALYGHGIDLYRSVRPGLTGFWQVSGRNHTSFHQRTLFDIYYIRNWSVWLDIHILFRTVWVVLSRDGAY
ncbi:MAG: lipid carrier--UDP-N-acetylgalactosaminyltransferase [Chloroflexi bacterium]|nr:MAG: lipid carrier--UDP-N-acetylgalactosaminyltransferase [Chloroflexota bacterium]